LCRPFRTRFLGPKTEQVSPRRAYLTKNEWEWQPNKDNGAQKRLTERTLNRRRERVPLDGGTRDAHPDKGSPEAAALRLRAEELAAGLDARTGGWFSRALVAGEEMP